MHTEKEIKVLDINPEDAEKLLLSLGYVKTEDLSFRRYVYDVMPVNPKAWIRLRSNGKTTTLTFKESVGDSIDGMKEIEVVVANFDDMNEILKAAGHEPRNYQENSRVNYEGKNCTISIDSWPQIPTYMEIESTDIESVNKCLEDLSDLVSGKKTTSLSTEEVYKSYNIELSAIKVLKF